MTRHPRHGCEYALIADSALAKLQLRHRPAAQFEDVWGLLGSHDLLLALPESEGKTYYAVGIAQADDGEAPAQLHLYLNGLLRLLRKVGQIGQCHTIGDLLLQSQAGVGIV